jgi:hypothetical protein
MFTVWSPFDGEPIPAPNEVERDILLHQGYLAERPNEAASQEADESDEEQGDSERAERDADQP